MSDISVNILGHIFEQSLTDLEEINASINHTEFDSKKSKRKKDGVFYTPEYITKYIVDNTLGKLSSDKREELNIGSETLVSPKNPKKPTKKEQKQKESLELYRTWLLNLKILDPACGSGAFLNQALDFLINEHKSLQKDLVVMGDITAYYEIEKIILENNLYGVDINEDAVEIAKLSLWLRTASKGRELTKLADKIKCGNSLIDDKSVVDNAFDWHVEFAEVFENGGFDVVIGNPPYVRSRNINDNEKRYIEEKYNFTKSGFDLSTLFIERILYIKKDSAVYGLIATNKFFSARYGFKLREYLLENKLFNIVLNFDSGIFNDTPVETSIIISNLLTHKINYQNYKSKKIDNLDANKIIKNQNFNLLKDKILFFPKSEVELLLLEKNIEFTNTISDYFEFNAGTGITNIRDYLSEVKIENTYPVYTGKSIWRYENKEPEYYIESGKIEKIRHFNTDENIICIKELSTKLRATKISDEKIQCFLNSVTLVKCKKEKLNNVFLSLFNSKLFSIIYTTFYESTRTHSNLRFKELYIKNIPIPSLDNVNIQFFNDATLEIITLNKKFVSAKQNFINELELEKIPKKLQNFEELDFNLRRV